MYEDLIDLGKEYYIWLKKEKKDRQQFVYPLPQHLTKNQAFLFCILSDFINYHLIQR